MRARYWLWHAFVGFGAIIAVLLFGRGRPWSPWVGGGAIIFLLVAIARAIFREWALLRKRMARPERPRTFRTFTDL